MLGYSSSPVGVWNLGVLQVHSLPPNILVQQDCTVVGPWVQTLIINLGCFRIEYIDRLIRKTGHLFKLAVAAQIHTKVCTDTQTLTRFQVVTVTLYRFKFNLSI